MTSPTPSRVSLYWLDGRCTAALERALTTLQDDPHNWLADIILKATALGAPSSWSRNR